MTTRPRFLALSISRLRRRSRTRPTRLMRGQWPFWNRCSANIPDHPGVAHYLIHAYDAPSLAAKDWKPPVPTQRSRRMRHMRNTCPRTSSPEWERGKTQSPAMSAQSRRRCLDTSLAKRSMQATTWSTQSYSSQPDAAAKAAIDRAMAIEMPAPLAPVSFYARSAMPARYAVERGDWNAAATLPVLADGPPYTEALRRFAPRHRRCTHRQCRRGRSGDKASRRTAGGADCGWQRLLGGGGRGRTVGCVRLGRLRTRRNGSRAVRDARSGRQRGSAGKAHHDPGRILPARELLADMLMEAGQPAAALAEYEKSFQRDPNRFRGLYGAGRAAEAAGDQTKALDYANRLIKLTGTGDTIRPEMAWAEGVAQ